jgi:putative redox protein
MRTDLSVSAIHRGGMRVDVQVRDQVLAMDYPAPSGAFPTPLEVLLASLAGCAANTLNLVLSVKPGVKIDALYVDVKAERRDEHPTILTNIEIVYRLATEAVEREVVDRAIRTAEDHLCPVLAMLRPGTSITSSWTGQ